MKPEDVPQEWEDAAMIAYWHAPGSIRRGVVAALAAVAPLIAAREREACAAMMEAGQPFEVPGYGGGSGTVCRWWAADAAAAIRARGTP